MSEKFGLKKATKKKVSKKAFGLAAFGVVLLTAAATSVSDDLIKGLALAGSGVVSLYIAKKWGL